MIELTMEQGSLEWHEARSGIVTSTRMNSALGTPAVQKTLLNTLVAERMAQNIYENFTSDAMQHGNDTEDMARIVAAKKLDKNFEKIGMIKSEIVDAAMSPDAVYREGGKIVGGLEIKCPNSNKHVEYLIDNSIPKGSKGYYDQVLTPFILSDDVEWWVFMSYDYRNYQLPEFYRILMRSDIKDDIKGYREKLAAFNKKVNDAYFELCGFDYDGETPRVWQTPEMMVKMMKPMSEQDNGIPIVKCNGCGGLLDAADQLSGGDVCGECSNPVMEGKTNEV